MINEYWRMKNAKGYIATYLWMIDSHLLTHSAFFILH
jgi:hypothetical protein